MDNSDERVLWLEVRVSSSLKRGHSEVFKRMLQKDDSRQCIAEFLETPDVHKIFLYFAERESLVASSTPPTKIQTGRKLIYFMKPHATEITMKNISNGIVFGDIVSPQRGLEHMLQTAQDIYLPVVSKQDNLPPSVRKEALAVLHNFLGDAYVLAGQVQGKTLLSTTSLQDLPNTISNGTNGHSQQEPGDPIARTMALETCVVQWIQQMKTALTSSDPPATATLLIELDFWLDRADNLNSLWEQLDNPRIERVISELEAAKSTFTAALRSLRDEVKVARDLANSNANHLRPLRKWLLDMNTRASGSDFLDVADTFPPLVHIIYLIWKTSSYYNNNTRLVVLLQDLCNNVIDLVRSRVSSKNILSQDPTDVISKLETTIAVCTKLREIITDYKKKANWEFASGTALYRLEMMVARDFYQFRTTVKELEARLAAVLNQAFEACNTVDAVLKLMESFGPLLERDIIRVQLEQLETVLLKYLNDDFVMVKTEFDQLAKKEKAVVKEQGKETFSTRIND